MALEPGSQESSLIVAIFHDQPPPPLSNTRGQGLATSKSWVVIS